MSSVTDVGAERLRTLYSVIAGLPDERVHLREWREGNQTEDRFMQRDCGTKGCSVGWGCALPEFQEQGLAFDNAEQQPKLNIGTFQNQRTFIGWSAVREFFGVSYEDAERLFASYYLELDAHLGATQRQHALRRIRVFLMQAGRITPERNAELALEDGAPA